MHGREEVKHTPGPWAINFEAHRVESDAAGYPNDGWALCEFMGPDWQENARLTHAGPEMLAALLALSSDRRIALGSTHRKRINAAIAKATSSKAEAR